MPCCNLLAVVRRSGNSSPYVLSEDGQALLYECGKMEAPWGRVGGVLGAQTPDRKGDCQTAQSCASGVSHRGSILPIAHECGWSAERLPGRN